MKYALLNHLYKLKRIKDPIQNPVVQQQTLVPMMNIDHLALLVDVCFQESFESFENFRGILVILIHFILQMSPSCYQRL